MIVCFVHIKKLEAFIAANKKINMSILKMYCYLYCSSKWNHNPKSKHQKDSTLYFYFFLHFLVKFK